MLAGFGRLLLETFDKAGVFADRLRHKMRDNAFDGLPGSRSVTISLGVSEACPCESIAELIARADTALYAAKRAGRNCVKYST